MVLGPHYKQDALHQLDVTPFLKTPQHHLLKTFTNHCIKMSIINLN